MFIAAHKLQFSALHGHASNKYKIAFNAYKNQDSQASSFIDSVILLHNSMQFDPTASPLLRNLMLDIAVRFQALAFASDFPSLLTNCPGFVIHFTKSTIANNNQSINRLPSPHSPHSPILSKACPNVVGQRSQESVRTVVPRLRVNGLYFCEACGAQFD